MIVPVLQLLCRANEATVRRTEITAEFVACQRGTKVEQNAVGPDGVVEFDQQ